MPPGDLNRWDHVNASQKGDFFALSTGTHTRDNILDPMIALPSTFPLNNSIEPQTENVYKITDDWWIPSTWPTHEYQGLLGATSAL